MWTTIRLWLHECEFLPVHTLFLSIFMISAYYEPWENVAAYAVRTPLRESDQPFYVFYTIAFTHVNSIHLWNNALVLLTLGMLLEVIHGPVAHLTIFWGASVTGALTESFLRPNDSLIIRGSSAGVYGLLGAYIAHTIINWKEAPFKIVWMSGLVFATLLNIYTYYTNTEFRTTVGHWAHVVGATQGVCLGIFMLKNARVLRWERKLEVAAFVGSSALLLWPFVFVLTLR